MLFCVLLYVVVSGLAVAIMYYEEEDQLPIWLQLILSLLIGWLVVPFRVAEIVLDMFKPLK